MSLNRRMMHWEENLFCTNFSISVKANLCICCSYFEKFSNFSNCSSLCNGSKQSFTKLQCRGQSATQVSKLCHQQWVHFKIFSYNSTIYLLFPWEGSNYYRMHINYKPNTAITVVHSAAIRMTLLKLTDPTTT